MKLHSFDLTYVPRQQIARVYILSKLAYTKKPGQNQLVIQETLAQPSIEAATLFNLSEITPTPWKKELSDYLEHIRLPEGHDNAVRIKKASASYLMLDERLYRRGFWTPLLRCYKERSRVCPLRNSRGALRKSHWRAILRSQNPTRELLLAYRE